mmetsp:Transcript_9269/g.9265  ORF Transcript_9269/g.9265 Transcript_9269/m.9265 type:complete len:102 (+) Transcript_9269:959-1264(+)
MLTHIGSYINAQSLLLELLDQNKGNQGRNIDALAENLAHNLAKNPDLNVLKAMAEETLDYEEILLIAAGNDIERAFFYTTNLEMFSKAYKKAYEKSINSNN